MKDTPEESADLKMALKHDPVTDDLREEARRFPAEAQEAYEEVVNGYDERTPGSWVDDEINSDTSPEGIADAVRQNEEARRGARDVARVRDALRFYIERVTWASSDRAPGGERDQFMRLLERYNSEAVRLGVAE